MFSENIKILICIQYIQKILICIVICVYLYVFKYFFLLDAHCERLPDDPAQGLLFESESDGKYIPFFENVTVACHEIGRPLRSTVTAGFRQCVFDPREGLPQHHWLSGSRPTCPRMFEGKLLMNIHHHFIIYLK